MPLTQSLLTSGTSTSGNPFNTASISPAAGSVVYVAVVTAQSGTGVPPGSHTVSGCGLTWSETKWQHYGYRRALSLMKGVGTPSSGALTITATITAGDYQESKYAVVQVAGQDATPNDAPTSDTITSSGTALNLPDVGAPGAGDCVLSCFGLDEGADTLALTSGITEIFYSGGGANVRILIVGWDSQGTVDETPGATWQHSDACCGGIACIINVGAAAGGIVRQMMMYHGG